MQKKGKFDYILLETTGLADPGTHVRYNICVHWGGGGGCDRVIIMLYYQLVGPIAQTFWVDEELGSDIYLDGMFVI